MTNRFMKAMGSNGLTYTENNALTHASSGSKIIDWFFHGAALRNSSEDRIVDIFVKAFREDPTTALRILFYIRDVRGGQGERRVFRTCLEWLAIHETEWLQANLSLIPHYGRWDDLWLLLNPKLRTNSLTQHIIEMVKTTLALDMESATKGESVSLMCKWLPSINTSSSKSRDLAKRFCVWLGMTPTEYRKTLSFFRSYLDIVECKMSAKKWNKIDYSKVPSQALRRYKNAFNRNDELRYQKYLQSVEKGESKVNTATLYPYQLVETYTNFRSTGPDKTIDLMWDNLPDYVDNIQGLVVADTSGSMNFGDGRPMDVSVSLAMYIAERNKNPYFKDYFISFSSQPKLHKIEGKNLYERCKSVMLGDIANTDLIAVFKLILDRAVHGNVPQEDMPNTLFIVSDMEFDQATYFNTLTNFEVIDLMYAQKGYQRPKLVFWNVASRNNQSPVQMHETGTMLISGCSPVIFKYALTAGNNPMDIINSVTEDKRYSIIDY